MLADAIRLWNPWWATGKPPAQALGIRREIMDTLEQSLGTNLIKGIIGPRRTGKTVLLYQTVNLLIEKGIPSKDIVMLNFDDNSIFNSDFDELMSECKRINPDISHLFLDEVQEKKDWARFVRTLYDTKQFSQIFVTGSSSSLLKEDVGRVLTGRHVTFHMLPLSFREYLSFLDWTNFEAEYLEHHRGEIRHHLDNFMSNGGFPEPIAMDEHSRKVYLNDLFHDILARDISARRGADHRIARRIGFYIATNSSKTMSHRSIANACGVVTDTVTKYLGYMEDAGLVIPLRGFSFKLKEQMREINKYYLVDTGLAGAVSFKFSKDLGRILENVVHTELLRRSNSEPGMSLYYWKDQADREVDFVVRKGSVTHSLIQACWDPSDGRTKKRETSSLLGAMDAFSVSEGTVITDNIEASERVDGKEISYVPLWKWLLEYDDAP